MQLIILIGVQGAGKSTFSKRFFDSHIRLNRDMLKTRHREQCLFEACLLSKTATLIDKTNATKAERAPYIQQALSHRYEVVAYYFDVSFEDALTRNNQRQGKGKIPEVGLKSTLKKMQLPNFDEGFDSIYHVTVADDSFIIEEQQQP